MSTTIDETSKRYGRLVVLAREGKKWKCKCDCGNIFMTPGNPLRRGATVSCGCYNKEKSTKHGCCKKSLHLYRKWRAMIKRCYYEETDSYYLYGARGITVCDRWRNDISLFFEDMYEEYIKHVSLHGKYNTTIDRIDSNKNYEKSNCRFLTRREQANNTRSNNFITYKGKTKTISEWTRFLNIPMTALYSRIYKRKWTIDKSFNTPVSIKRKSLELDFNGEKRSISSISKEVNVDRGVLYHRIIKLNWTIERAIKTPVKARQSKKRQG